ncbi:MAG: nitrogenase [Gracilibacteraceae bacterium]|jgi:nitrogenase molybdenum-iron protein alpha chain|nr:nitrogenase [Gracilibacteraceae bacterium]
MTVNLKVPDLPIREQRLGTIMVYEGTAKNLCEISREGKGCGMGCSFNQNTGCGSGCAMDLLALVRDTALINHGAIGCAADFNNWSNVYRLGLINRGLAEEPISALSSNLQEKDTVFGGLEKLRATILETRRRFAPKAIWIITSCVSGIIGDDIEGLASEMEREAGIPIVPIYCEGFKSKVWATGFDAALHGILRKIVRPPQRKQADLINVVNFAGTHVFTPLLAKVGLRVRYIVPFATLEDLAELAEAAASTQICETLGTYFCHALETEYGVPEVKAPPPYGMGWTDAWLREIGRLTHKEAEMEELIRTERAEIAPRLAELREALAGKTAYIFAGDSYAHSFISVIRDLGMKVIGSTAYHHDARFDNTDDGLNSLQNVLDYGGDVDNFTVFTKQPYIALTILKKLKPDLLIFRHPDMASLGFKLGITTVCINGDANRHACYLGVLETGEQILAAFTSRNLYRNLAEHAQFPYTEWWYEQENPFVFAQGMSDE